MELIAEIIVSALLIAGGFFGLVGSLALIRLPDLMSRLHGPGMATTLGVGSVLIAALIWFPVFGGGWSWHELLITIFLLATAPITGHFIAKAHLHLNRMKDQVPKPPKGDWATFSAAEKSGAEKDNAAR
ncbi:Na+/H+ antiporter subunit G [Paracoccus aminophilus]|uniref:Monovalent cation/H+ antiporter, subunit G n=1 Tax=Paracoccus aminophilus JCM 7686 TaxID=1367847 RepID=S5XK90_PARAH|nr:Na+/H+ antiporter subunit G [Paracoccus aminophilus]AGT07599.1 monovalent cation/H+ antiporter, subunit G [Paracoccus aminophilus JCM 7686]